MQKRRGKQTRYQRHDSMGIAPWRLEPRWVGNGSLLAGNRPLDSDVLQPCRVIGRYRTRCGHYTEHERSIAGVASGLLHRLTRLSRRRNVTRRYSHVTRQRAEAFQLRLCLQIRPQSPTRSGFSTPPRTSPTEPSPVPLWPLSVLECSVEGVHLLRIE
uniref:Uncharacterized protein n=4 Tax=unclassified bacterial viruses TaxID=12333 RepID=A0AAU6W340_9VIRU